MDLNSDTWLDLVFEGKNRKYGAYYLRQTSSRRHLVALIITAGIAVVSLLLMLYIVFSRNTNDDMLKSVAISDLTGMESLFFEDPAKFKTKETSPLEEKVKPTPPEIVQEDEFVKDRETEFHTQTKAQETIPEDATDAESFSQQIPQRATATIEIPEDTVTYMFDENDPSREFQLLRTTILRYVYQNLKYPEPAYKQRIRGRVICSFIVNEDGTISDIALVKGVYIFLDEEVLRILHSMPACESVKKDNTPVKIKCYLPVMFSL